jgi:hypothetical protein
MCANLRMLTAAAVIGGFAFAVPASAEELVVGSFGGSFADNLKTCHVAAFEKATGATVSLKLGNSSQFAAALRAAAGIDVPFLGVNDMAGSIGRLEQLDKPDVRDLMSRAEAAMKASGKPFGGVPSAAADWRRLVESGYRLIPTASDIGLLRDAASDCIRERKQYLAERTTLARPA